MNPARIQSDGDGRLALHGDLDFSTVPALALELSRCIGPEQEVVLSLAGVGRANSAGLVLLLEAMALADTKGVRLCLESIPESLLHLASMCNLDPMLQN